MPPQDLAAAVRVCTTRRCLVRSSIKRSEQGFEVCHSRFIPLDLVLVDPANLSKPAFGPLAEPASSAAKTQIMEENVLGENESRPSSKN
jgi:hypothetical protein